ncbi:DUF4468 domain-containing protein [Adhaeribacter aquaticus]|uniref:DUF4468 domain-containing protein n=1 Tax=Adhaeribacter aquaticus TaxID=299567 RepID=UPI000413FDEE|nr:DUF4468 domain-containing protein [Adhaeribacter aquaticus]
MKHLLRLLAFLILLPLGLKAQTLPPMPIDSTTGLINFTEVVQVPDVTSKELYTRGREWFATAFRSADAVLEMEDKDSGKLIGKAYQDIVIKVLMPVRMKLWYTVKIQVKDGRYKYDITNLEHQGYYDPSLKVMSLNEQTARSPLEYMYKNAASKKKVNSVMRSYYENDMAAINGLISSIKAAMSKNASKEKEW